MSRPRRGKGDGSLHKRADGRWTAYVTLPSGDRTHVYGKTRAAAADKLRLLKIRLEKGGPAHEDKRTLGEYLDWWITDRKSHLAHSTWRSYEAKIRLHLKPTLGVIRVTRLTPMQVRDLIATKVDAGYSSKQIGHIHDVLHAALEDARKMELIDRNVAALVDTPRVVSAERTALTIEEANALLRVTNGDRLQPLYRLLLTLGLRPGEGLGLRWQAIDFEARTIRIEKTLLRKEGEWILGPPKTPKSKQTLPLPASLAAVLLEHRERQRQEREVAGAVWEEWDLVFPRPNGLPSWYSEVGRALSKHCEAAGIPRVTMHELRHTTPSILLAMGVDQRVIMHILRHSTIVLTANLYTHVADPTVRAALDHIDGALQHDDRSD